MSKIIIISSNRRFISETTDWAVQKSCQVEHYTEQEWKNKRIQTENDNVISISKGVTLPAGRTPLKSLKPLGEVQMETIRQALYSMNGNISRVSKALNIGRATLYRKIKDYDIDLSEIREEDLKPAPIKLPLAS